MKKMMVFSGCFILLLASMVFMSYAEMQKIALSEGNLADLKGKWVGSRSHGSGGTFNTDLEIFNDSLPIQGKFIFYDLITATGRSARTQVIDFKRGKINDQGNLFIEGYGNEWELSLYKDDGKLKLEGHFSTTVGKGTMSFKKK